MWIFKNKLASAFILIVISLYGWYFFYLVDNIPREDEYWLLADFNDFYAKKDFNEQISTLFKVKNSHRFVPVFAIYALVLKVFGTLNLKLISCLSLSLLICIILILSRPIREKKALFVVPLFLILLNPLCYSMSFFPEHAMQYLTLFATMLGALYLISYQLYQRFWLLILLAIICSFSFGNGLLIWIIGSLLIALKGAWKKLIQWISISIITYILFFINFENSGIANSPLEIINHLDKFFVFVVSFPGGGMDFFPKLIISDYGSLPLHLKLVMAIRVILVFLLPVLTLWLYFNRRNNTLKFSDSKEDSYLIFTTGIILFVVFSGALAGIFRSQIGYGEGLATRYRFFGQLFIVAFYLLYIHLKKFSTRSLKTSLLASIVYWMASYAVFLPEAKSSSIEYAASELNALDHGETYIFGGFESILENTIDGKLLPSILDSKTFSFSKNKLMLRDQMEKAKSQDVTYNFFENTIILKTQPYEWSDLQTKKYLLIESESKLTYVPLVPISYFSKLYAYSTSLKGVIYPSVFKNKHKNYYLLSMYKNENKLVKLKGMDLFQLAPTANF